ncbi:MAG: hypothetical protein ACOYN0_10890 [Phycisphaerales bacterium]
MSHRSPVCRSPFSLFAAAAIVGVCGLPAGVAFAQDSKVADQQNTKMTEAELLADFLHYVRSRGPCLGDG